MSDFPQSIRTLATLGVVLLHACGAARDGAVAPPTESVPAFVVVTPEALTLHAGGRAQLGAELRGASGAAGNEAAVWSSSVPSVAQVAADGTVTAVSPGTSTITARVGSKTGAAIVNVDALYDLVASGVPRIVTRDYIELGKIARVSRFRSGFGHDYADDAERCRSMKHYFQPVSSLDWSRIVITSPVTGTISAIMDEQTFGKQLRLAPAGLSGVSVIIFHVTPDPSVAVGTSLAAGDRLGTHVGSATMSDVAIQLDTPGGRRLVSYFDAMTDEVFAGYQARGAASRAALVIPAGERDASPLSCSGGAFQDAGTLPNWVSLP